MHGRIFWQFRDYVAASQGPHAWSKILQTAGLTERVYLAQAYPDVEAVSLVTAAAKVSGKAVPVVLREFGEFTVPSLLQMYSNIIKPEWRTLDVIEHAEKVAHSVVRREQPGAAPPFLRTHRESVHRLVLTYNSPRRLCALAIGVGLGLGKHFHEDVVVEHPVCRHAGADRCEIVYTIV